jgi:hypothetical protein
MNLEAFILACGILTYEQAIHIMKHKKEYNTRAVACAVNRWKQEQPKPKPLKTLRDVPQEPRND